MTSRYAPWIAALCGLALCGLSALRFADGDRPIKAG